MKFYITSLDLNGKIDNCIRDQIMSQLDHADNIDNADYVALCVTYFDDWEFYLNEFQKIKHKPFVIFDFIEYGHNSSIFDHIISINTDKYKYKFLNKDYLILDEKLKEVNIKCYFKRELGKNHIINANFPIKPIDYLSLYLSDYEIESEEKYYKRPIDIFFTWGWSSPSRPLLHGCFYQMAEELNYSIVSDHSHLYKEKKFNIDKPLVYSAYTPHHSRMHMSEILALQGLSKISISLNGAGVKCYRHSESPINSLMALQENDLKWNYEWDDSNSIILPNLKSKNIIDADASVRKLIEEIKSNNLYDRYVRCVKNNKLYNQKKYIYELLRSI